MGWPPWPGTSSPAPSSQCSFPQAHGKPHIVLPGHMYARAVLPSLPCQHAPCPATTVASVQCVPTSPASCHCSQEPWQAQSQSTLPLAIHCLCANTAVLVKLGTENSRHSPTLSTTACGIQSTHSHVPTSAPPLGHHHHQCDHVHSCQQGPPSPPNHIASTTVLNACIEAGTLTLASALSLPMRMHLTTRLLSCCWYM